MVHWFLSSAEAYSVAEADEDVPRAYLAGLSEVVLVTGYLAPSLMPCCLVTSDCYCSKEQDCSEAASARDAV